MKKLILLLSFLTLLSCSSSDDDSNGSKSSYSPPIWIQGTWGVKSNLSGDKPMYKFSADNVCQITSVSSICWKETIQQTPNVLSGSDKSTSTTYEANFIATKGASTITLSFEKISATQIKWINTSISSGYTVLEKLN